MTKKYELTNETIEINGYILDRIRSLVDIPEREVKVVHLKGSFNFNLESSAL